MHEKQFNNSKSKVKRREGKHLPERMPSSNDCPEKVAETM